MKKGRINIIFLVIGIILTSVPILIELNFDSYFKEAIKKNIATQIQEIYLKKEKSADYLVNLSRNHDPITNKETRSDLLEWSQKEGILLSIYINNDLQFYTSNEALPEFSYNDPNLLVKLKSGYYVQKSYDYNDTVYVSLIPIKSEYQINNNFLKPSLSLTNKFNLTEISIGKSTDYEFKIKSQSQKTLFSIEVTPSKENQNWLGFMSILGLIFLFIYIKIQKGKRELKGDYLGMAIYDLSFLSILLFLWLYLKIPSNLFKSSFFGPEVYGSIITSFNFLMNNKILKININSLGDLFMMSIILHQTYKLFMLAFFRIVKPQKFIWAILNYSWIMFLISTFYVKIIQSLVMDSNISFDASDLFGLNIYSLVAVFVLYLFTDVIIKLIQHNIFKFKEEDKSKTLIASVIILVVGMIMLILNVNFYSIVIIIGTTLLISFFYIYFRSKESPSLYLVQLGIICLFTSNIIWNSLIEKDFESAKLASGNIIADRDAISEYLFPELIESVKQDNFVSSFFINPNINYKKIQERITQVYFQGYFSKYDINVYAFNKEGVAMMNDTIVKLEDFNKNLKQANINNISASEDANDLYFKNDFGKNQYITSSQIIKDGQLLGHLGIVLTQKTFFNQSLYPELLLSDQLKKLRNLEKFSFAFYKSNYLYSFKGNYPFPQKIPSKFLIQSGQKRLQDENYNYIISSTGVNEIVVLCYSQKTWLTYFANFSFLLTLTIALAFLNNFLKLVKKSVISFLNSSIPLLHFIKESIYNLTFRIKIQMAIIGIVSITFIVIGISTIQYFSYKFYENDSDQIKSKATIIKEIIEQEINKSDFEDGLTMNSLQSLLKSLSTIYQLDINIFMPKGNLLTATQKVIFDKVIFEKKINPIAYYKIADNSENQVELNENKGTLEFNTIYCPLLNTKNQIVGFFSIPTFTQQVEVKKAISSFIVNLLNIYILLFFLMIVISAVLSNTISAPIIRLAKQIGKINISGGNRRISKESNDEIGQLIEQYNIMLNNVEDSAVSLATSERESAWREMAKQVAHEIKNPLTPIKLHIQRLQMAYLKDKDDGKALELIPKVTELVIKQIDVLASIATEFSNFAKFTDLHPEIFDIEQSVKGVIDLFSMEESAQIFLDINVHKININIDKNGFERAVGNLIKNGIQSVNNPALMPTIFVQLSKFHDVVKLTIKDNGSGIDPLIRDKIFRPNFSTKNSGMGLGLAIVKNIIESSRGQIYFETEIGIGTSFHIELPIYYRVDA